MLYCVIFIVFVIVIKSEANGETTVKDSKNYIIQKRNYTVGLQNIDLTATNESRLKPCTMTKFHNILRSTFTVEKSVLLTWTDTMNFNIEISQWLGNISIPIQIKDEYSMSHYNDALDYKLIDDYGIDNTIDGFIILTNKIKYVERLISTILIKLKLTNWDNRNKLLIIYFDYFHCYTSYTKRIKYNKQLNSLWRSYSIVNIVLQVVHLKDFCPKYSLPEYDNRSDNSTNGSTSVRYNSIDVKTTNKSTNPNDQSNKHSNDKWKKQSYESNKHPNDKPNFLDHYMYEATDNRTITCIQIFGHNPFSMSGNSTKYNRTGELILLNDENRLNDYFTNRLLNLHGYPLTISLFFANIRDHVVDYNTSGEDGGLSYLVNKNTDPTILRDLSKFLNFTVVLKKSSDNVSYGTCRNQVCSGTLKDIVDRTADLAFNRRFLKWYGVNTIEYLLPIETDSLCVVVRHKGKITGIKLLSVMYSTEVFCLLATVMLITIIFDGAMYYVNKKYFNRNINTRQIGPIKAMIGVPIASNIVNNNNRHTRSDNLSAVRLLIGSCLIFGVVFNSLTQGVMYQTLRTSRKQPNIDTLKELKDSEEVNEIRMSFVDLLDTFNGPESQGLKNKIRLENNKQKDEPILYKIKNNEKVGVLVRKSIFENVKLISNHSSDYFEFTHLVKECPRNYYLSYILPRGSYLREPINYFLYRVVESGLFTYYHLLFILYEKNNHLERTAGVKKLSEKGDNPNNVPTILNQNLKSLRRGKSKDINNEIPFKLEDLYLAFYILIYGLISSFIVFVIEIIVHKRKNKVRHSN